ncbi:hypothetical protein CDL12_12098 [Handroanthus impetiginosus]|uniref:Uncharacterized protein n=1 Tax=Handroanthus impetiginosus TaxID=429701 RepID=A0A2G9HCK6_9LAMI|nr:hypothetical protein CDL12_12098 [Handroanthus impetiginosus]
MSTTASASTINYDKMGKKCCGIKGLRLNPRRFSVQRLRTKFLYIFRLFRKSWRNSYRHALRLLRRNLVRRNSGGRSKERILVDRIRVGPYVYSSAGIRTMTHSNSFCSEAIADCLEFIKRNSVSIDDDRKPMLEQQ